jgi:predicted  nucleic acid-binding Zn-ribbon protein
VRAQCIECGAGFHREEDEDWKTRCITCFKKSKRPVEPVAADSHWRDRALRAEKQMAELQKQVINQAGMIFSMQQAQRQSNLDKELAEQLPRLLLVCHPDKHGNSQAATKVTQWLLDVRGRLSCA